MYQITSLPNRLRIVTHHMKERGSIAVGFWIGAGGRYEDDSNKGAAHFLEHMLFKGSRKYTCEQIKELIEGVGGSLNAFTSEEQTCYYAKIPAKHINQTFDVLADMVLYPKLSKPNIDKERTVILEEIKMYNDLPQYRVVEMLESSLWADSPLSKPLIGTFESVRNLSKNDLRDFHRTFYHPANIVVSAGGNVDHAEFAALVKRKFGFVKNGHVVPGYVKVHNGQDRARVVLETRPIEQMHLALGFPGYDENHKDRYILGLLGVILGGSMSSRLFVEVREKRGLAYSIGCSVKFLHDTGVLMVRAGLDNQKVVAALKLILKELRLVRDKGVRDEEFALGKEYFLGQLQLGLEDTLDHMLWIGEDVLVRNQAKTLDQVTEKIKQIKRADIQRVAEDILKASKLNVAVVGPLTAAQQEEIHRIALIYR